VAIRREHVQIRSYDVDFRGRATAEAICRIFLDAAWSHAELLGVGYEELAQQGKFWVLARLLVEIYLYPQWGETVELTTWPRGINGAFALRDFEICNEQGKRLVAGTSYWLVLDATTHRPQRIDKLLLKIEAQETRMAIAREPKKLSHLEKGVNAFSRTVGYSDIDVNRHVNSARYIGWLIDSYPADFHQRHSLRALEVNYIGESRWTDCLAIVSSERSPREFSHAIVKPDQTEVCRAELSWSAQPAQQSL
jgi:medium-chain acyl-[acyl-carrier-protein] hydrolase